MIFSRRPEAISPNLHTTQRVPIDTKGSAAEFQQLRRQWRKVLLDSHPNLRDPIIRDVVAQFSGIAEDPVSSIQQSDRQIWPDLSPLHLSINFRRCYSRLKTIAVAYSTKGTSVYQKKEVLKILLTSLDILSSHAYNSTTKINKDENWWNYKIGAAQPLIDISMILYDEIGVDRRKEYALTTSKMIGNLDHRSLKGSNRAIMCQIMIGAGILSEEAHKIEVGRAALFDVNGNGTRSVLGIVTSDDGFYQDGSYISHHIYPYAGGYGLTHILAVSHEASVLHKTSFALSHVDLSLIYESIRKTFTPFVFRGMVMGNVRGREISRKEVDDRVAGNILSVSVLRLAKIAPQPYKSDFESLLLSWNEGSITTDKSDDSIQHATSLQKLRHKQALHPAKHNTGFQILPMSDRVVYHHQNWSATIAMSSNRTGRYESINSENLYPHYQGAGLFQLYLDNDRDHYLNDYYPTRRTHHLPGVTAGKNVQKIAEYGTRGTNAWAGGVKWNESGAASFDYISHDQVVNVKKSWFFVGDMILAMGTGCNGFNKTAVHTTIEARKMPNASRRLVVDGETLLKEPQSMESTHASWAHIDGVGGYHFLDFGKVNFERRNHTGRWTDINRYPNYIQYNETLSREYITVYRDHGVEPVNDRYVYAVLPNATIAETKAKLENLTYHILSNTPWVQAVALADQKVVMATFWQPGKVQDVEALNPCQIVWGSVGKHDKELLLTVADPSQQQEEIKFWLERPHIGKMISSSPEMQVVQDRGARKLIHVNVRNSSGQTFAITFGRYEETSVTELRTSWILLLMLCTVAVVLFVSPGARQSKEQSSNRLWRLYRNMRSR